jgi:hypothetical protein
MPDDEAAEQLFLRAIQESKDRRFAEAEKLLRRAFAVDPTSASGHRAYLADILSRGADLQNVSRLAPFRLNTLVHSGWLHSLISARAVNAQSEPIPWFTQPSIDFLEPKVQPHWNVLEWGSGNSTLWWASRVASVTSIEHDPVWHRTISGQAPANVNITLVENPHKYPEVPNIAGSFDAIVIDGPERNRCAESAARVATRTGIIIFDNSDRQSVREGLAYLTNTGWKRLDFFGLLPAYLYRTCTSIFFRDDSFLATGPLPCDLQSSLGPTCAQVLGE